MTAVIKPHARNKIVSYAEKIFEKTNTPGVSLALIEGDELVFCKGFGVDNLEKKSAVSGETLFPVASITKSFTGASLALLEERSNFDLNTPVRSYLPDFKFYHPYVTQACTFADLISHRTGIYSGCLEQLSNWGYTAHHIQKSIEYVSPRGSFRGGYAYANVPYLWVDDLFQTLTQISWKDFLQAEILTPLGLSQTSFGKKSIQETNMRGYILDEETKTQLTEIQFSNYPETFLTAGGLISSARDIGLWIMALLGKRGLFSETLRKKIFTPLSVIDSTLFYGLGLRISDKRPHRALMHGGLIQGIRHQFCFIPSLNVGCVMLTNFTDALGPLAFIEYFCDAVMDLAEKDYLSTTVTQKPLRKRSGESLCTDDFSGTYHNPILGHVKISDQDLLLEATGAIAKLCCYSKGEKGLYFINEAGENIGEGHWGTLFTATDKNIMMKGYESFSSEEFLLTRV